jgi:hypothetical protein
MEHKRSAAASVAIAVLLLLPLLYVGSYLALAVPEGIESESPPGDPFGAEPTRYYRVSPFYAETIFWPLERLDPRTTRDLPPSSD